MLPFSNLYLATRSHPETTPIPDQRRKAFATASVRVRTWSFS